MEDILNSNDNYVVESNSILSSFDRKIIALLYQPIIGYAASSLYFSLWSELDVDTIISDESRFNRLLKLMMIDLSSLIDCFNTLEAIGLIDTYTKESVDYNSYLIKLYSPKSPDYYFNSPLLVNLLKKSIGSEYQKTMKIFENITHDLKGYKKVSKKYKEVFGLDSIDFNLKQDTQFKNYNYASINYDIDWKVVEDYLAQSNNVFLLKNKQVKKQLELVLSNYKLPTSDVLDILLYSIVDNEVDLGLFLQQVKLSDEVSIYNNKLEYVYIKDE
ncbi:MAG: hypothetical protein ACRCTA_04240, partial [Bacilli bacterium]